MSDQNVHPIGHVEDIDGCPVTVGVDYDAVTISGTSPIRLGDAQAEEFARLYVEACWEAGRQSGTGAAGELAALAGGMEA